MKLKITLAVLVCFLGILSTKSSPLFSHKRFMKSGVGNCPKYSSFPNFSTTKFQGQWFVNQLEDIKRFAPCQMFNFTATSDYSMNIEGSALVDESVVLEAAGESNAPNKANPAFMLWTWKFFPLMIDRVTVLDTDYHDYAVILLCQSYVIFHNEYPILLTRQQDSQLTYMINENHKMKMENAFPFSVGLEERSYNNICRLDEDNPGKKVKTLNIDKAFADFTEFLSTLT